MLSDSVPRPVLMAANFSIASDIVDSIEEDLFSNFCDCSLILPSIWSDWVVIFWIASSVMTLLFWEVFSIIAIVLVMDDKTSAIFSEAPFARETIVAVLVSILPRI